MNGDLDEQNHGHHIRLHIARVVDPIVVINS